jgi:hypothetical protein
MPRQPADDPELGTLVAVAWLDAHASLQSEMTIDEIAVVPLTVYTSYGKLVRCDEDVVAVAADERDDGRYRGITFIPAGMVQSITSKQRRKRCPKVAAVEAA